MCYCLYPFLPITSIGYLTKWPTPAIAIHAAHLKLFKTFQNCQPCNEEIVIAFVGSMLFIFDLCIPGGLCPLFSK